MATLLDIAEMMDTATILVKLRSLELTKFVALKMLAYLVGATPVDTSKALSNWRVSIAGSAYGAEPIEPFFPGVAGSTARASADAAVAAAHDALKNAQPGKALAIINRVPYIQRLNEGWSSQSPGGFVERAILVGRIAVKQYNFNRKLSADIKRGSVKLDG